MCNLRFSLLLNSTVFRQNSTAFRQNPTVFCQNSTIFRLFLLKKKIWGEETAMSVKYAIHEKGPDDEIALRL